MVDVLTPRLAATLPGAPDAAEEPSLERLLNHRGGDRDTTVDARVALPAPEGHQPPGVGGGQGMSRSTQSDSTLSGTVGAGVEPRPLKLSR
jgi:hypothetical protein